MSRTTLTAADQDARVARAIAESGDWTWTEHDGSFICETRPGSAYLVSETTCTCPDWEYRCSKNADCRCKHQVALGMKLLADGSALVAQGTRMVGEEPMACSHCHEPVAAVDLRVLPATGELICALCEPATGPAGPEELAKPERIDYFAISADLSRALGRAVVWTAADEATLDRIFG